MIKKEKNKYTLRYITETLNNSQKQISDSSWLKEYIDMTFLKEEDYENYPLNINFNFKNDMLFLDGSFDRKVYSYNFVEFKSIRNKMDLYRDGKISFKNLEEYLFDTYYKKVINLYKKSLNVDSNLSNYFKKNISFSDLNVNAQKELNSEIYNEFSDIPHFIFSTMSVYEGREVSNFFVELLTDFSSTNVIEFGPILVEIYKRPEISFIIPMIIKQMDPNNSRYYFFSVIRYLENNVEINEKDKNEFLNLLNHKKDNEKLYTNFFLEKMFSVNKSFLEISKKYLLEHNSKYYYANKLMILNTINSNWLIKDLSPVLLESLEANATSILISDKLLLGFRIESSYHKSDLKPIFLSISKRFKNIYISKRTLYFLKEHYEFETNEPFPIKDDHVTFIDQAPEEVKLIETCDLDIKNEKFVHDYFDKYNVLPVEIEF